MTTSHFFGDAEHPFDLTADLLTELERTTGTGIGALAKRTFSGGFHYADLLAIVRLGLIGGGMSPKDAADLVAAYAPKTPIAELYPVAAAILEARYFGDVTTTEGIPE